MATVIVRSYADAGFVIAADGRQANTSTYEVRSDARQKIFKIGSSSVAYSMMGIGARAFQISMSAGSPGKKGLVQTYQPLLLATITFTD
jgi:hypothetical protein